MYKNNREGKDIMPLPGLYLLWQIGGGINEKFHALLFECRFIGVRSNVV